MEENASTLIEEVSQSDWEKTPESVKRLVANLMERTLAIRAAIRGIQKPERAAARAGAAKQQEYIQAAISRHQKRLEIEGRKEERQATRGTTRT